MSVERYFKEVSKTTSEAGYGVSCKALVTALLECDDGIFTVARTDSDTTTLYTVWLQVYDTNLYLKLWNNSGFFNYDYYNGLGGTRIINGSVQDHSFCNNAAGYTYRATISKLGDFAFTLTCMSQSYTVGAMIRFGQFVSDVDNETYYVLDATTTSGDLTTYDGCKPSMDKTDAVFDATTFKKIKCVTPSNNLGSSYVASAAKCVGVLQPFKYCLYATSEKWLGHVRWGGKYDLYRLTSTSGTVYNTLPNADYNVDGVTYKGVFNELIIPVECP